MAKATLHKILQGNTDTVLSVAFSPDSKLIASASADKTVRLWNLNGNLNGELKGNENYVWSVAFSPDCKSLVTGNGDNTVRTWSVANKQQLKILKGHSNDVGSVAWSPNGALIASGSNDEAVILWDAISGSATKTLIGHTDRVYSVSFSQNGNKLVSAGAWDNTVIIWDVHSGAALIKLAHSSFVFSACFSHDDQFVVTGCGDSIVRMVNAETGHEEKRFEGHTNGVISVAFSFNGSIIASSSDDKSLRLWDVASTKQLQKLDGHTELVLSVAFSRDGKYIASGSNDKIVRLWNASSSFQEIEKQQEIAELEEIRAERQEVERLKKDFERRKNEFEKQKLEVETAVREFKQRSSTQRQELERERQEWKREKQELERERQEWERQKQEHEKQKQEHEKQKQEHEKQKQEHEKQKEDFRKRQQEREQKIEDLRKRQQEYENRHKELERQRNEFEKQKKQFEEYNRILANLDRTKFRDWSIDEVCVYLEEAGVDEDVVAIFRKQEIRGISLPDMAKDEVLKSMGIDSMYDCETVIDAINNLVSSSNPNTDLKVHEILRCELTKDSTKLNEGKFGIVWRGTYNGIPVAIKEPKLYGDPDLIPSKQLADLVEEATVMTSVSVHPNVLHCYGISRVGEDDYLLVTEFCNLGSLDSFLRAYPGTPAVIRRQFSQQIARGLNHLAQHNIAHRDIAARNVLLHDQGEGVIVAKVCDFGLSRQRQGEYYKVTGEHLLSPETAPEVFNTGKHSTRSDVWSFGVLLWEVESLCATRAKPDTVAFPPLSKPAQASDNIYAIMLKCWANDPHQRPSFEALVDLLV